jgi:hypothetical protein
MAEDSAEIPAKAAVEAAEISNVAGQDGDSVSGSLPACCVSTIRHHVKHNPMMVCSQCKFIIKCFSDERAYQNYIVFCRSRRRPVVIGIVDGYFTCAFRSYDTFSR